MGYKNKRKEEERREWMLYTHLIFYRHQVDKSRKIRESYAPKKRLYEKAFLKSRTLLLYRKAVKHYNSTRKKYTISDLYLMRYSKEKALIYKKIKYKPENAYMSLFAVKQDMGLIISLKDGIGILMGLRAVNAGELVECQKNYGLVLNLQRYFIGVVFLSEENLQIGSLVKRLHQLISLPITIFGLGKVLDALGLDLELDFMCDIEIFSLIDSIVQLVEIKAPNILDRQSVYESVPTGSKILDAIVPIGKGQRELIIGDRQTGKTAIAVDSLLNQ